MWTDPACFKNAGLHAEYTRIEPFVYTHDIPTNVYENYNTGLGSDLQPNSDRILLQWDQWFSLSLRGGAGFSSTRHGRGDRRTPHTAEDGNTKNFLAGVVERKERISVRLEYEPVRDLVLRCEAANVRTRNRGLAPGSAASWVELLVKALWNW
jgi:hypothetical protein